MTWREGHETEPTEAQVRVASIWGGATERSSFKAIARLE